MENQTLHNECTKAISVSRMTFLVPYSCVVHLWVTYVHKETSLLSGHNKEVRSMFPISEVDRSALNAWTGSHQETVPLEKVYTLTSLRNLYRASRCITVYWHHKPPCTRHMQQKSSLAIGKALLALVCTVKSLYWGHHWGRKFCLYSGVSLSQS